MIKYSVPRQTFSLQSFFSLTYSSILPCIGFPISIHNNSSFFLDFGPLEALWRLFPEIYTLNQREPLKFTKLCLSTSRCTSHTRVTSSPLFLSVHRHRIVLVRGRAFANAFETKVNAKVLVITLPFFSAFINVCCKDNDVSHLRDNSWECLYWNRHCSHISTVWFYVKDRCVIRHTMKDV